MHKHRFLLAALLVALGAGAAAAQPAPSFTISATNITMSINDANIPFTLTSLNGYTGTVAVGCKPPSVSAGTNLPYCGGPVAGGGPSISLKANATVTGGLSFHTQAYPVAGRVHLPGLEARAAWALAGVFLLGFGFRRRRIRWLSMMLLSAGMLAGFAGLTACGGGGHNPNDLTPGTYNFTLTGTDTNNVTASTGAQVIILPGIPR